MIHYARVSPVFLGETGAHRLEVYMADGTQPSLAAIEALSISIVDYAGAEVQAIADGDINREDDANGNLLWTPGAETVSAERFLRLFLSGDGNVIAEVGFTVQYAPTGA